MNNYSWSPRVRTRARIVVMNCHFTRCTRTGERNWRKINFTQLHCVIKHNPKNQQVLLNYCYFQPTYFVTEVFSSCQLKNSHIITGLKYIYEKSMLVNNIIVLLSNFNISLLQIILSFKTCTYYRNSQMRYDKFKNTSLL